MLTKTTNDAPDTNLDAEITLAQLQAIYRRDILSKQSSFASSALEYFLTDDSDDG